MPVIGFAERTLRYGIVGLAVSVAYSLAVALAVHLLPTHNPTWASVIVFLVMLPIAYLAHRSISFFDAAPDRFQPLRFAVSTVSTFLIAVGGMYAVTEILGRSYLLGLALNWALIPAVNFLIYLFWVFRVGTRRPAALRPGEGVAPATGTPRPSRQPLRGFLRTRSFLNDINQRPHPKEACSAVSKDACQAGCQPKDSHARSFSEVPTIANGFVKVGQVAELDEAGQFSRWVGNHDILVFRYNGAIRGLSNICPHFGGPVGYYQLRNGKFTCLWHNLQFDAESGRCVGLPKLRLREYKITVQNGEIYAQLVEEEPSRLCR
jgi:nitrite reductase/ring-hydroxylating ferredoxin subunit/putative flippase GtrA